MNTGEISTMSSATISPFVLTDAPDDLEPSQEAEARTIAAADTGTVLARSFTLRFTNPGGWNEYPTVSGTTREGAMIAHPISVTARLQSSTEQFASLSEANPKTPRSQSTAVNAEST